MQLFQGNDTRFQGNLLRRHINRRERRLSARLFLFRPIEKQGVRCTIDQQPFSRPVKSLFSCIFYPIFLILVNRVNSCFAQR